MPVKKLKPRTFYSISKNEGKIRYKDTQGVEHLYDVIEGRLTAIELKEEEFEGAKSFKWYFHLEGDNGELDILQIGEPASAARGIITSLSCIEGPLEWISIAPYQKKTDDGKTFVNVWFEHNGQTVDWLSSITENIPPIEQVEIGGRSYINDEKRRNYYRALVARIKKEKLNITSGQYEAGKGRGSRTEDVDDMATPTQRNKHSEAPPPPGDSDRTSAPPMPRPLPDHPPHSSSQNEKSNPDKVVDPVLKDPEYQQVYRSIRQNITFLKEHDPSGLFLDVNEREIIANQLRHIKKTGEAIPIGKLQEIAHSVLDAKMDCEADDDLPF